MQDKIVKKLNNLNKEFYQKNAKNFSDTRNNPWEGYQIFWEYLYKETKLKTPNKILDIACGNGRFADFVKREKVKFSYLGIDNGEELLKIAHTSFNNPEINFEKQDLLANWQDNLQEKFDLIVIFGFMHHIPGFENRLQLLKRAKALMNNNSRMIVSLWDFYPRPRFKKKIVAWEVVGLKQTTIETNDYLITWGADNQDLRYCHFTDLAEQAELIEKSGLTLEHVFSADGKDHNLNRYLILN